MKVSKTEVMHQRFNIVSEHGVRQAVKPE